MTATVLFDKFPSGKLIGDEFADEIGFDKKNMAFDFRIVRVHGRVRWKDHGSGEACAVLTLKRKTKNQIFGELELAEYARGSSTDEFTPVQFDFEPHAENAFWQQGATGKVAPDLCS